MTWREMLDILQKIPERYLDDVVYVGDLSQNNNPNDRKFPVVQLYEDINDNCDFSYEIDIDTEDWIEEDLDA